MIAIEKVDHLGIRITDRSRALAFCATLGFKIEYEVEFDAVITVKNAENVELNLIVNGVDRTGGKNILMDVPDKHPGITTSPFASPTSRRSLRASGKTTSRSPRGP